MFLLIVDLVSVLPLGCRQQCLPPRLCCPRAGVAFFFSSACCSPPSFLSGRSATVLASLSSLSSSGCVLSLSCACRSRLASCRRGVGLSWALPMPVCFRPAVAGYSSSRACCSPAVSPRPCFWGGVKPAPKTSLSVGSPWAVYSPSQTLLVSWVGGLSSGGVGSSTARRSRKNDYIYIIPAPLRCPLGVCFPQSPYQIQYKHQRPNSL